MKIKAYFINYRMQNLLIDAFKEEKIYHRIKANHQIEFSEKWRNLVFDLCVEITLDMFYQANIYDFGSKKNYEDHVFQYTLHNIPFFTFVIDENYYIVTDEKDIEYILDNIRRDEEI